VRSKVMLGSDGRGLERQGKVRVSPFVVVVWIGKQWFAVASCGDAGFGEVRYGYYF